MAEKTHPNSGLHKADDIQKTAFEMEPELNTLKGVLVAYRTFAGQLDPIDPTAIGVLARCGEEALERLSDLWRSLLPARDAG